MSIASSHWHGDVTSDRFQRVYGTAFFTQADLDAHLEQLEQARQRDHRVVGQRLGLFAIDEQVGQGLILWKPKGAIIRDELQRFITEHLKRQGYSMVFTPHIGKLDLYRTSGHFPYYSDSQYPPMIEPDQMAAMAGEGCACSEITHRLERNELSGYLLKPMNCPHHIKIYSSERRSYRDLPIRLSEFGTVYRWEQSGELSGMTRVRGFTQDDAHLFVREDQLADEVMGCLQLVKIVFKTLGMDDYRVRVGLRDPDSSKFTGDPQRWDKAEAACGLAAESLGVPFTKEPGEAAFYGPKIDFVVRDVIGREWQLGTVQVDYNLPERFDLTYAGSDNQPHRPVMIHRAPFGSMERFVGVPDRTLQRCVPTLARPRAGPRAAHQRQVSVLCSNGVGHHCRRRSPRRRRRRQRAAERQDQGGSGKTRSRTCWSWAARMNRRARSACDTAPARRPGGPCRWRSSRSGQGWKRPRGRCEVERMVGQVLTFRDERCRRHKQAGEFCKGRGFPLPAPVTRIIL